MRWSLDRKAAIADRDVFKSIAFGIPFIMGISLSTVLVLWHSGNGCNDRCNPREFKEENNNV